ncbi:phosphoribosylformylglycinamidine synthase subunit PurS [Secundilactobacillus kimchicus]|nr:phosphoribosylformylglycinamidine synthase subunit PurS [Secundilactobacillus kimchicus]MBT9671420.1 phosphoribosylformylglycinamidine synthase subunit PurS [Secundilactobacillus kimchicus]
MYLASIMITIKPSILDPEAVAIKKALNQLNVATVAQVKRGQHFELTLAADSLTEAETIARQLCDQLLVNPTMETYVLEVKEMAVNS